MIKESIVKYIEKHSGDDKKINELAEFIENFFIAIPDEHTEVVKEFKEEIDDFMWEYDEEILMEIISHLRHRNGDHSGMKWSVDDVTNVASQYGIESKFEANKMHYDCLKFWFAMNYVYAVHYSSTRVLNGYVELALDEIFNKNICFDGLIKRVSRDI